MPDPIGRVASWLKAYLLLALLLTSLWTQLDALRWGVIPLVALVIALELSPGWFVPGGPDAAAPIEPLRTRLFPQGPTWLNVVIGASICLPVLLHVVLTSREEFPFGGDEGYEFSATRSYALLLKQTLPYVIAWAVLVFGVIGRRFARVQWTVFLLGLLVLSYRFPPHVVVARYPAGFYFLAAPLNVLGEIVAWRRPFFANHVVNAWSIPAWLFVLRPMLLRKWPDWTILPLGVFLFYQKETLQFFGGGSALEPWAIVCLCLAIEALIVLSDAGGWLALMLLGCSFMIKEPGVFVFPVVWLVAASGSKRLSDLARYAACGLVTIAPFAVYYSVRRQAAIHRTLGFGGDQQVFTSARVHEWADRVSTQFGATGLVVVVLLALYGVAGWGFLRDQPRHQRVHAGLVVTAFALLVFNFSDELAVPFNAYTRYMLYPLALMALLLVPPAINLVQRRGPKPVICAALVILVLQAIPLVRTLALDLRPDFARNSLEWEEVPLFFPVRDLLGRMGERPDAAAVRSVRLLSLGVDPIIAPVAYPDLNRRWPIHPEMLSSRIDCGCRSSTEAVLLGVGFRTAVALEFPVNRSVFDATQLCVSQLRSTCSVIEARHDTGDLVGILGIPGQMVVSNHGAGLTARQPATRRIAATAVLLFLAITSVDGVVLWRTRDRHLGVSEDHFDKGVLLYQTGSLSPNQVPMIFRPPGFPVFVAGMLKLSDAGRAVVAALIRRPAQRVGFRVAVLVGHAALMGSIGVALFVFLARRTGSLIGIMAAVAVACSPILLVVATQVSYPLLHVAVLVVASVVLLEAVDPESPAAPAVFGSGLLWGLATLIKPVTLVTPIFVALWAWPFLGVKRALATTAVFTLGLIAAVAPYTIRNYVETGRFIPVNQQASFALWATSLQRIAPTRDYLNWVELWFQSGMRTYTEVTGEQAYRPAAYEHHLLELSDRFETMAWTNVREHPAVYLYNALHNAFKFVVDSPARFWFGDYFDRGRLQKPLGRFFGLMSLWILMLTSAVSIVIGCLKGNRQAAMLLALFALMWAAHSLTFLEARYLYVKLPTIFIGFALSVRGFSDTPSSRDRHRTALILPAAAAAVALAGLFLI